MNAIDKLESKFLKILVENKELSNTVRIQGEKITKLDTNMKKLQSSHDRRKDKTSSSVDERPSAIENKLNTFTPQNKVNPSDELENRLQEITGNLLVTNIGRFSSTLAQFKA